MCNLLQNIKEEIISGETKFRLKLNKIHQNFLGTYVLFRRD